MDTPKTQQPKHQHLAASRLASPWVPAGLVVLAGLALGGVQYASGIEVLSPANAFLATFSTVGMSVILVFLWSVLFAPISRAKRKRIGVVGLVALAIVVAMIRVEGVSGDIMPRLRFRWLPHADEMLPAAGGDSEAAVDLKTTTPDDSPQFLGPHRVPEWPNIHLESDWSEHPPREVWKQAIGAGWGSFAVVGHFGVTQEQRGQDELITCYDIDTGALQWSHATPVRFYETLAGVGPRATPTIDEGRVYAMGAKGHVTCLDGATGEEVWQHDVLSEFKASSPQWGKSCSPLVYENMVIVSAGGNDGNSLVAFDKMTGDEIWTTGYDWSSYSSPTLMVLDGQKQIVMVNATTVTGHDPSDGRILWKHPWPEEGRASPNVSQPISIGGDRILMSKGYGIGSALWQIKHDEDDWSVEPLWRNNNLKTKFTNVVVRDGYAYGLDEGILSCVEIESGKRKWKKGKYNHGQVLLVGELLLVQSEQGELALVEARPEGYRELARFFALNGQTWNYPTLTGRRLIVRSDLEAACYELTLVGEPGVDDGSSARD
jgi:outer membrane protein assembly factor BamB